MTEEDGVTAEGDITPIIALTSLYSIASIQYSIFYNFILETKQYILK